MWLIATPRWNSRLWFFQPLSQIEPLLVLITIVIAAAALIPIAFQIVLAEYSSLLSPLSRRSFLVLIFGDIPIAVSGAAFALLYGWFPGMGWLSIVSFGLVSVALLIVLVVYIFTILEFVSPKVRDRLYLPQFVKAQAEDLEDLKKETGGDITTA